MVPGMLDAVDLSNFILAGLGFDINTVVIKHIVSLFSNALE